MAYLVASIAFIVYDVILLFGKELKLIWKGRPTFVKAAYMLYRYGMVAYMIISVYSKCIGIRLLSVLQEIVSELRSKQTFRRMGEV